MIFEKNSTGDGYELRYYTFGILKNEKNVTIPSTYKGLPVTSIRGSVFENDWFLNTVEIPDSVVEIRGGAFKNCVYLTTVNLPPNITEIHGSTFENCYYLDNVVIPEGVTRIGGSAFRDCSSLSNVTIPKTVNEIGSSAFRSTSINNVCISSSANVNFRAFKETDARIAYYEDGCEYSGDDYNYEYYDYGYEQ